MKSLSEDEREKLNGVLEVLTDMQNSFVLSLEELDEDSDEDSDQTEEELVLESWVEYLDTALDALREI